MTSPRSETVKDTLTKRRPLRPATDPIRIFVHLGHGFGAEAWQRRYESGLIPGINEALPYGYHRAAREGVTVEYSQDADECRPTAFFRRTLCRALGFDLVHAWRNREQLVRADIVWTHTEREHLAVLLLARLIAVSKRPRVIAQCVWLFDNWHKRCWAKRKLQSWLLEQADIVTTLSPENLKIAHRTLPASRTELILFGIKSEQVKPPSTSTCHFPIRVAALGSDMHRDWRTLFLALGDIEGVQLRIGTTQGRIRSTTYMRNVAIEAAQTKQQVQELYEWADMVVVPLQPNLHASGVTVMLEATLSGRPVIATDTGGLNAYFSSNDVVYVPIDDPMSMRRAVFGLCQNDALRVNLVLAAQRRIRDCGLTSDAYVLRHLELTLELIRKSRCENSGLSAGRPLSVTHAKPGIGRPAVCQAVTAPGDDSEPAAQRIAVKSVD